MRGLDLLRKVRDVITDEPLSYWDSFKSFRLRRQLRTLGEQLGMKSETQLISFEMFCFPPFFTLGETQHKRTSTPWVPPSAHIEKFCKFLAPDADEYKFVVTVRNQTNWLASMYSQFSYQEPNPGQQHFVSKTKEHLSSSEASAMWFLELDQLGASFAKIGETIFLPLEQITSHKYWKELQRFTGLHFPYGENWLDLGAPDNQRHIGSSNWEIRPRKVQDRLQTEPAITRAREFQLPVALETAIQTRCETSNSRALKFAPIGLFEANQSEI